MSVFTRKLNLAQLNQLGGSTPCWLDELFQFWAPAGSGAQPSGAAPLRLAIRDNYVNFYINGQSVAKVAMGPQALNALVHEKYFQPDAGIRKGMGQKYCRLSGKSNERGNSGQVSKWMQVAATYKGQEKSFVEELVANNPNVIDLEMALPSLAGERSAARVDLVALEPAGEGWRLVFWEAKMATNKETSARGDVAPKVVSQREKYYKWLQANKDLALGAYTQVCRDLVDIHGRVVQNGLGDGLHDLGEGIRQVAEGRPLVLDDEIRLVIGDWDPNGSFDKNGHRKKLADLMIVQVVAPDGDRRLQSKDA